MEIEGDDITVRAATVRDIKELMSCNKDDGAIDFSDTATRYMKFFDDNKKIYENLSIEDDKKEYKNIKYHFYSSIDIIEYEGYQKSHNNCGKREKKTLLKISLSK